MNIGVYPCLSVVEEIFSGIARLPKSERRRLRLRRLKPFAFNSHQPQRNILKVPAADIAGGVGTGRSHKRRSGCWPGRRRGTKN